MLCHVRLGCTLLLNIFLNMWCGQYVVIFKHCFDHMEKCYANCQSKNRSRAVVIHKTWHLDYFVNLPSYLWHILKRFVDTSTPTEWCLWKYPFLRYELEKELIRVALMAPEWAFHVRHVLTFLLLCCPSKYAQIGSRMNSNCLKCMLVFAKYERHANYSSTRSWEASYVFSIDTNAGKAPFLQHINHSWLLDR